MTAAVTDSKSYRASTERTRRARRRRRLQTVRSLAIAVVILLAIGAFLLLREHLRDRGPVGVTAVLVEPRAGDDVLAAADLHAQLDPGVDRGDDLVLAAVLDGRDATVLTTSLACEPDMNPLVCEHRVAPKRAALEQGVTTLLQAPVPPRVEVFATLGRLDAALTPEAGGTVNVVLNLTGRGRDAYAPDGVAGQVDEVVAAITADAVLLVRCDGWQVHVLTPQTTDPAEDLAREQVYRRLVEDCGGVLARYAPRWPVEGEVVEVVELPEPPQLRGEAVSHERDAAQRQDTFRLDDTLFDVGSAELRAGSEPVLAAVVDHVRSLSEGWSIEVHGYADATGQPDQNQLLSEDRARRVADELRRRLGTDQRISDVGHGSFPDDGSDEARQANRRVDVIVRHRTAGE